MSALATDDFNRANEATLTGNWTTQTGENALKLQTNVVTTPADVDCADNYNAITWPNDQYSQAALTATTSFSLGDGPGVGLRMSSSAQTFYRIVTNHITGGNNIEIGKKVTSTHTSIVNRNSGAWTDGAIWYAEVQGTTLLVKLSGSQVGASTTDSAIATGRAGIAYSGEGSTQSGTWDTWEGGDFAGASLPPGGGESGVGTGDSATQATMMR